MEQTAAGAKRTSWSEGDRPIEPDGSTAPGQTPGASAERGGRELEGKDASPSPDWTALVDVHAHHIGAWGTGARHTFVASGFSRDSNAEVMRDIAACPKGYFSLGLGPQEIQRADRYPDLEAAIGEVEAQVRRARSDARIARKLVAIGEVGLDKHWGKTPAERERQFVAFERMIALAMREDLPLIIHSRDAEEECIRQLLAAGAKRVVMHCFGGTLEQAKRCAQAGWLISIPPQPNAERKRIIKALDLGSLVVETDAPYIGRTSEEALGSAEMIARYKGLETAEVVARTGANARRLLGLGPQQV